MSDDFFFRQAYPDVAERQARTMDRAHESWREQEAAVKAIHDAIARYADLVFDEWHDLRGCSYEAAYGVVKDRLLALGTDGIQDHLNRLYHRKVSEPTILGRRS